MPPIASRPKLVTLTSRTSRRSPKRIRSDTGVVDRQHLEGKKRQQQADPADDAREDRRPGSTARRSGRACRASRGGRQSAGGRWRSTRSAPTSSRWPVVRRRCAQGLARPIEALDRAAVELLQEVGQVGRDEVDEGRTGGQGFLLGERPALRDRLLDQGDVALALRGDRPGVAATSDVIFFAIVSSTF